MSSDDRSTAGKRGTHRPTTREEMPEHFGKFVKELRSARGISQAKLAEMSGVSVFTISSGETSASNPWKKSTAIEVLQGLERIAPLSDEEGLRYAALCGLTATLRMGDRCHAVKLPPSPLGDVWDLLDPSGRSLSTFGGPTSEKRAKAAARRRNEIARHQLDLYALVSAEYDTHGGFATLPLGYDPLRAKVITRIVTAVRAAERGMEVANG